MPEEASSASERPQQAMPCSMAILKCVLVALLVALVAEFFLFNFRFWESVPYQPITYTSSDTELLEGDRVGTSVEFSGLNDRVFNIHIEPNSLGAHEPWKVRKIQVAATDSGHSDYFSLPETELVSGIPESEFIRVHLTGTTDRIRVTVFDNEDASALENLSITVNAHRPMLFRFWRMGLIFAITLLVLAFRPKSMLYAASFDMSITWQKALSAGMIIVCTATILIVGRLFSTPKYGTETNHTNLQYNYIAESLLEGHTWLNIEPPSALREMENPYDTQQRRALLKESGEEEILDFAYYNGRYWCYFGVVPAILFYMPWIALTGTYLSTGNLVVALACLMPIVLFWFFAALFRRQRLSVSVGLYLLLSMMTTLASGVLYFAQIASLYSLPILCAHLFGFAGLSCWLMSSDAEGGAPDRRWLVAGALSIALVMGCRPQLTVLVLFAFPIFWTQIKNGLFFSFSKDGVTNTACVILPFLAIGIPLMMYNHVRFGSPLDFGAQYNLTGFDMTNRGVDPERFLLGYWEYFFQPLTIGAKFPYVSMSAGHLGLLHDYQGQVINEPLLCGFFAYNLIGLFLLNLRSVRESLKEHGLWGLALVSVVCGLLIVSIDIQVVGMTLRYYADFALFLLLPIVLTIAAMLEKLEGEKTYKSVLSVVVCLALLCVATHLFTLLADGRYNNLMSTNPAAFYRIKYQLFPFLSIR